MTGRCTDQGVGSAWGVGAMSMEMGGQKKGRGEWAVEQKGVREGAHVLGRRHQGRVRSIDLTERALATQLAQQDVNTYSTAGCVRAATP